MLERKHIVKIEAIPAAVLRDFFNAFAPKRLRQMAVPYFVFRAESTRLSRALRAEPSRNYFPFFRLTLAPAGRPKPCRVGHRRKPPKRSTEKNPVRE